MPHNETLYERFNMTKITIARAHVKSAVHFVVARCVSATIVTLVRQNTDAESNLQQVELFIGAHVIGELVASKTRERTDELVDRIAEGIAEGKSEIKNRS